MTPIWPWHLGQIRGLEKGDTYQIPENLYMSPANHLGPALGGKASGLLLNDPHWEFRSPGLADFAPVGVGVEPVITNHDLPLVGDMGRHLAMNSD